MDTEFWIHVAVIAALVAASWWFPRTFGLLGMVAGHFIVVGVWGVTRLLSEPELFEDYFAGIQLAIEAFLFNCLMLPLGIWTMRQWQRKSPISPVRDRYTRSETTAHN